MILLMSLVLWCSSSISQATQTTNKLENDFSKSKLTAENVTAFEYRAKQKVVDLCNYVQYITDKTYETKFRKYSMKSAFNLFSNTNCMMVDSLVNGNLKSTNVTNYLDHLYGTKFQKIVGSAKDVTFSEKLTLASSGNYYGTISFIQILKCYNAKGTVSYTSTQTKTVSVTLIRESKKFGDTEKKIWVVSLCDLE